ncbi:MAG: phospho-sugar mutase [Bacteroidales bacterium]|nr:phospho-sugar mutase [Bacteroidales bacterium]MBN2748674.1 phospho-sugar mutase [Bacteroidales bacterium]
MKELDMDEMVLQRAEKWIQPQFDKITREKVQYLIDSDKKELTESFYKDLEFGTGGLRGIMGVGTNRMNTYTVGMATQGLSNYIVKQYSALSEIRVAIAFDSRNNSMKFADVAAKVFSSNGIKVYLFETLRPTPELSFAIRTLKCQCGIVVTASHNPKEYNGYKVYWEDGGQIVPPHDANIIAEVKRITDISEVKFEGDSNLIKVIGSELDEIYLNTLSSLSLSPEINKKYSNLKIVYTPLHGTGVKLVPNALHKFGFQNVTTISEQAVIDGNFPTVTSPNPEDPAALSIAIKKAEAIDADIVMATDPDADRVGIGVKNLEGKFVLLNGNQAASILIYYLLTRWSEKGKLKGREFIVKTIVTTDLISEIAKHYNVDEYNVLTGFKYIAEMIRELEGVKTFIGGGEESYGYLAGDFVRDKDAVLSCALFAEITAWAKNQNKTTYQILLDIYKQYGLFKEHLVSITKKGKDGAEQIKQMMKEFRQSPPLSIDGSPVIKIYDYELGLILSTNDGSKTPMNMPKSDVLQFLTKDGTRISVRPSGTEPKIKFYFGVKKERADSKNIEAELGTLDQKIERIVAELKIQ